MNDIFDRAAIRAQTKRLDYTGEVTPAEAAQLAQQQAAVIVDVRTLEERAFVGQPVNSISIPWAYGLQMQRNEHFLSQLQASVDPTQAVLFLCRSGARSHHAAQLAAQNGYVAAYNISEGFEGDKNAQGQRRSVNGWVAAGLPWQQS